jgi:hypothetical protein
MEYIDAVVWFNSVLNYVNVVVTNPLLITSMNSLRPTFRKN